MAGNIQPVSFVNPLDPGGAAALAVQQQAIQRRQALAQALQQESLQDSPANGGRVSWTQGAARLAQALAARGIYKDTQQQQVDLATKQGQMMARMFGLGGNSPNQQTAPSSAPDQQPTYGGGTQGNAPGVLSLSGGGSSIPTDQISNVPSGRGAYGSGGVDDDGSIPAPNSPPQSQPAPIQAQPAQPSQPQSYPMSLSGNPTQDYTDYTMNPEKYTEALIASHSPVDMAKTVAQARAAMDRGDMATAQALLASVQKQNYIPPVSVRQGGVALDPVTHQPIFQAAQAPEGSNVNYGPDGKAQSITPIQGGAQAIETAAAAKAVGGAAGDLVQVYDPRTHQMINVPKSAVLSGAANGQTPMAAAPPLGASSAFDVTGKNSANAFQDISNGAADVPNRIYALKQMQTIAADPNSKFGVGSEGLNHFNSLLGTISQSAGIQFDPKAATNANEFQKWATQYSARSGQELGLSGSDARTQLAVHATPNGEMTRQALQSVIPQMIGIENAKQGYAQAANVWQRNNGPQSVQDFRTEWNKVYNPSIYTHMSQGPQAFAGWVKSLNPQQAAQVRQQYLALKQIGALPQ